MYSSPSLSARPIETLAGTTLNGKWLITELLPQAAFQTGSCFSVGYRVTGPDGSRAFAKVLDFSAALQQKDTARALSEMTDAYIFERTLLEMCGSSGMSRVVKGLDSGDIAFKDVPLILAPNRTTHSEMHSAAKANTFASAALGPTEH